MRLLIRADATPSMGTGHVMRCIALSQAWQDIGGNVTLAATDLTPDIRARLANENIAVSEVDAPTASPEDARRTIDLAKASEVDAIVVDGYQFDTAYQGLISDSGLRQLFIDDYGHCSRYDAGAVLNQNIYASRELYSHCGPGTKLLLGTSYALLRREFRRYCDEQPPGRSVARRILVTLGGSDSGNVTGLVLRALQDLGPNDISAVVVAGGSNPHVEELRSVTDSAGPDIELRHNVSDMPELMSWADIAVSAAGTTSLELAFMGLPALLIVTADNQKRVAEGMEQAGAAVNIGRAGEMDVTTITTALRNLLLDETLRKSMNRRGRKLVDGRGPERTCAALTADGLFIRPAVPSDCPIFWRWANDPHVRAMALKTDPIAYEDHVRWFEDKLDSDDTTIFVLEEYSEPVGQLRFDADDEGTAEISISVAKSHRGKGLGSWLLREGTLGYRKTCPSKVQRILGRVKPENHGSCAAFEAAGFRRSGEETTDGIRLLRFVWTEGAQY